MNFESIFPFLLLIAPFAGAFLIEGIVIHFFRLKRFGASLISSLLVNLLTIIVLYASSLLLGKLGYQLGGLHVPLQAMAFFWWLSMLSDGWLLRLFVRNQEQKNIFLCSIVMNTVSYLFLYVVVTYG